MTSSLSCRTSARFRTSLMLNHPKTRHVPGQVGFSTTYPGLSGDNPAQVSCNPPLPGSCVHGSDNAGCRNADSVPGTRFPFPGTRFPCSGTKIPFSALNFLRGKFIAVDGKYTAENGKFVPTIESTLREMESTLRSITSSFPEQKVHCGR